MRLLKLVVFVIFSFFNRGSSQILISSSECPKVTPELPCTTDFISYRVHDREHKDLGQLVEVTDKWNNLSSAGYDPTKRTAVIIHGFADSFNNSHLIDIKNELLLSYDMFVIFLDWSGLVPDGCYIQSAHNVAYAGKCLAVLLRAMGLPSSNLHLIGFSLGAHVPAYAADRLTNYKIPRITGLDPALPMFFGWNSLRRLRKSDAKYVDVIHTNVIIQGSMLTLGHADFYVNNAILQPGCPSPLLEKIQCSHQRALEYYAESINTKKGFWGCDVYNILGIVSQCRNKSLTRIMGYHVDTEFRGVVQVETASKAPFALGK